MSQFQFSPDLAPSLGLDAAALAQIMRDVDDLVVKLIKASRDCVKLLDLEGYLLFMNLAGRCAREVPDFEAVRGTFWPELWPDETQDDLKSAVRNAAVEGEHFQFCGAYPTGGGEFRVLDVKIVPVYPAVPDPRRPLRILAVSRDCTDEWRDGKRPDAQVGMGDGLT